MDSMQKAGALSGRILLGVIFVGSGFGKFANPAMAAGYMEKAGMPMIAVFLYAAAILELVGGAAVIVGFHARWAALALFLFLIPATIIFHLIPHDTINTMKNLAIMGGLLMVASLGAGGLSFDSARGAE